MGLYIGNTRYAPILRSNAQNYRGSYNIVSDLHLNIDAIEEDIANELSQTISNPEITDYCFVDVPFECYTEVSGYDSFSGTSDYVDYYVVYNNAYTLVTNDNKDSVGITAGTTIAYNINYRDYFKYIYRFKYNGSAWVYEYDTDFSGCANVDADNFTDSGTTFLSGLGMPSERKESFTVGSSFTVYTAPANGWVKFSATLTTTGRCVLSSFPANTTVYDNNTELVGSSTNVNSTGFRAYSCIPIKKGEQFRIIYNNLYGDGNMNLFFIYAEGTPTPPQP